VTSSKQRVIKSVRELPSWFCLEKYKEANDLDEIGWLEQLSVRVRLRWWIEFYFLSFGKNGSFVLDPQTKEILQVVRENGIFDYARISKLIDSTSHNFLGSVLGDRTALPTPVVRDMTGIDLIRMGESPARRKKLDAEENGPMAAILGISPTPKLRGLIDHNSETFNGYGSALAVVIDVRVDDLTLIDAFKSWLRETRSTTKTPKVKSRFQKHGPAEWIDYGLLPFLDISIWECETRLKVPRRVIADAIYPQGTGGEERVRTTTVPLAKHFIGDAPKGSLSALDIGPDSPLNLLAAKVALNFKNRK
jgi:Family of unknown function (DUF6387)